MLIMGVCPCSFEQLDECFEVFLRHVAELFAVRFFDDRIETGQ